MNNEYYKDSIMERLINNKIYRAKAFLQLTNFINDTNTVDSKNILPYYKDENFKNIIKNYIMDCNIQSSVVPIDELADIILKVKAEDISRALELLKEKIHDLMELLREADVFLDENNTFPLEIKNKIYKKYLVIDTIGRDIAEILKIDGAFRWPGISIKLRVEFRSGTNSFAEYLDQDIAKYLDKNIALSHLEKNQILYTCRNICNMALHGRRKANIFYFLSRHE